MSSCIRFSYLTHHRTIDCKNAPKIGKYLIYPSKLCFIFQTFMWDVYCSRTCASSILNSNKDESGVENCTFLVWHMYVNYVSVLHTIRLTLHDLWCCAFLRYKCALKNLTSSIRSIFNNSMSFQFVHQWLVIICSWLILEWVKRLFGIV